MRNDEEPVFAKETTPPGLPIFPARPHRGFQGEHHQALRACEKECDEVAQASRCGPVCAPPLRRAAEPSNAQLLH